MKHTHLGNVLRDFLYDNRISVSKLAMLLDVSTNTIYNWFKQDLLHPKWISVLSNTLEHDFYQYLYRSETLQLQQRVERLEQENEQLKTKGLSN